MHTTNANLLQTRPHYEILDGLRGVAAIGVLIYHFMEIIIPNYDLNFIAHGHLAVDFFFCLSGFVIAYAYDTRIGKIGALTFMKLRLIRLHPLVFLGAILGLISFIADPFSNLYSSYGPMNTLLMFLSSSFMVPFAAVPERYNNFFHFNPPTWSLFWEYVANIFYAVLLVRLKHAWLWILTVLAAGVLVYESYTSGHLSVGWGGTNFWGGGVRVFYSFLIGMMLYRQKWIIRSRTPFWLLGILLFITFLIPFREATNWWADALVVLFYFPLLVAIGAGAVGSNTVNRACNFLGEISYPLYMVHYPFIWLLFSWIEKTKPSMSQMMTVAVIGVPALILFAYLILKKVDEPIRKHLKSRLQQSQP